MANKLYDESAIQNIAIAIRSVDGTENTYSVSEMSGAIMNLSGGATLTVEETADGVKITATDKNGTTTATILYDSTVTVEETDEGVKITATDKNGSTSAVVKNGTTGKSAYAYAQDGGYTGTEAEFTQKMAAAYVPMNGITLGLHSDGKYYVFVDGSPVGTGFEFSGNSGDVFGYVDENNNIVLNGNLADGTYGIKYELEDEDGNKTTVDIGDLEVDTNVYYSVTNTLTNCTISNSATEAVKGESYSATITANSGFELKSVTVTMGGSPVSVSGGSINIANVTGNIVITAVAEEVQTADPTNFFKASPTVDTVPTASQDAVVLGGRLGSDSGYRVDGGPDCMLTNYIPVQVGDEVKITNLAFNSLNSAMYKSDKTIIGAFQSTNTAYVTDVVTSGNTQTFKIAHANAGYVRISGKPSVVKNSGAASVDLRYDLTQIIINIKRNGAWL